jgi:hypothetical protein
MNSAILRLSVLPFLVSFSNLHTKNTIYRTVAHQNDHEVITLRNGDTTEPTLTEMLRSINFTSSGVTCYLKHIYNCPKYAEDVIPTHPFKHFEEFIQHGIQTKQPMNYTKAILRLFDKKFKTAPYINPEKVAPFFQKLPTLLEKDLTTRLTSTKRVKESLRHFIQHELNTKFERLQQDPYAFISELSDHLLEERKQSLNNTIKLELESFFENPQDVNMFLDQLTNKIFDTVESDDLIIIDIQNAITTFIETILSKLYWSTSRDNIWENFLAIGKELAELHKKGIIRDLDALDDCQWTLTTRFCLFLTASGSEVALETYKKAKDDILTGIPHLDNIVEQEDLIAKKTTHLYRHIVYGNGKAEAKRTGILSEIVLNT